MNRTHSILSRAFGARIAPLAACLAALLLPLPAVSQDPAAPAAEALAPPAAPTTTLERIRQSGRISLGYRTDARPFSFRNETGNAAGYTVSLCQRIAADVKAELGLAALETVWVPVTAESRFTDLRQGKVDLLCGADTATLERRKLVDFSIPVFLDGIGALLRADAPARLVQVLSEAPPATRPLWRASSAVLEHRVYTVVSGSTSEPWLAGKLARFGIGAMVAPVADFSTGVQRVQDGSAAVFFADRAVLLAAAHNTARAGELMVLERRYTYEPLALAMTRGDDDFRLLVDRSLSHTWPSPEFRDLYRQWFGTPDDNALTFFRTSGLPD